jgi:hypothetical protein
MKVKLREPSGTESDLDNIDVLKDRVLQPTSAYWNSGSGDLGIDVEGGNDPGLVLAYSKDANGYFVQLYPEPGPEDWAVAIKPGAGTDYFTIYIGGEPMAIPEEAFISPALTWEVVQHFYTNGQEWDGVPWKSYWDLDWPEPGV